MEKFMKIPLGNYGIYIKDLWHISYAIKLWNNIENEGFDKGLILGWWTMRFHYGIDYGTVGLDFVNNER